MELIAKTVKIAAESNEKHFGSCFAENGLFVLLEVEGDEKDNAASLGRNILDSFLTSFTNQKEKNLADLTSLLHKTEETANLLKTITVGILKGEILYLGNKGSGEVLLNRGGKIGQILFSNETSSGKVKSGDILLFTSKTFCHALSQEKKWELLKMNDWQKVAEVGSSPGAAALIVTFASFSSPKKSFFTTIAGIRQLVGVKIYQGWQKFCWFVRKTRSHLWENEVEEKPRKTLLTITIILIILLTASIFLNINYTRQTQKHKRLSSVLELVSHQYEEAASLIDLNPIRARTLLSDSKLTLSPYLSEFPKTSNEYKQIKEWLDKIAEKEVTAYKIYKLTSVPLFYDIALIKEGGGGQNIAAYRQAKAILDTKNKVVYSLSSDTKQASIIAGSEAVKETKTIAIHGKTVYLFTSEGIVSVDISSKTAKTVIKTDEKWGEITSIAAFGGNLYLLDRKNNAIWKYVATETGFTSRASYLNSDVKVNFSKAQQMVIDGSVWVLNFPGEILKFTRGLGEPFTFKGLADTLSNIEAIFTSDVERNLYALEKSSFRILVFDKDGTYLAQYQWDGLKEASDFVVSEEEKKIFVLSGSKIYAIEIK